MESDGYADFLRSNYDSYRSDNYDRWILAKPPFDACSSIGLLQLSAFLDMYVTCVTSNGTFDPQPQKKSFICNCAEGTIPHKHGCGISKSAKCGSVGTERLWDVAQPCDCSSSRVRGARCESVAAEEGDMRSFTFFYVGSSLASATIFAGTFYLAKRNRFWLALLATIRLWDTMSDWAMWSITLHSDQFTKYSNYGSDEFEGGDGTFKQIQTASLVFTILGTVLLILDLGTLLRRFSPDDDGSGIGLGMCCIVLLEDIPQLVISLVYFELFTFEFLVYPDPVALASLSFSIISLVMNLALGCVQCVNYSFKK
jgi:hypothetical protein